MDFFRPNRYSQKTKDLKKKENSNNNPFMREWTSFIDPTIEKLNRIIFETLLSLFKRLGKSTIINKSY